MQTSENIPTPCEESIQGTGKLQILNIEAAVRHISRSIQACAKFGQSPLRWDSKSESAFIIASPERKLLLWFHLILSLIFCGFCSMQLVSICQDERSTSSQRIYIQMVTLLSTLPVFAYGISMLNSHDLASCLNMGTPFFLNYQKFLKDAKKSKSARRLPQLLQFIHYSMNVNAILYLLLLLARPHSPEWITSALPSENLRNSLKINLLFFPFYAILMNGARTGVIMAVSFTFSTGLWAREVLRDLSERQMDGSHARTIQKDLNYYSQMCIIMKVFDRAISALIPAGKLVVIIPATFSLYALVKLEGIVSLFCIVYAVDTTFLLQLALSLLAQPFELSSLFLRRVKHSKECQSPYMRRRVKALRPIAATVGNGMYFIDKQLMLTVFEIIVTNAVNVLLVTE